MHIVNGKKHLSENETRILLFMRTKGAYSLTQKQVADKLRMSQTVVSNALNLFRKYNWK